MGRPGIEAFEKHYSRFSEEVCQRYGGTLLTHGCDLLSRCEGNRMVGKNVLLQGIRDAKKEH